MEGKFTPDQLSKVLETHIKMVVEHYRGKIFAWDVVNEAFDEGAHVGKVRSTIWYDQPGIGYAGQGTKYLAQCFRWAHEADPEALLFYNEAEADEIGPKSDAVYAMRLPMWLLALGGISQPWLNYTRFAASEWRAFLRVALNVAGIVVAIYVLRAGDVLVTGPKWVPAESKSLATLNQMVGGALVLACILGGLMCIHELRRLSRNGGAGCQPAADC